METERHILQRLIGHGFQAYIVGGAVRDIILGVQPKDYDIVTSATPDQIKEVFSDFSITEVGKAFGIVVVHKDGESFEVATFRRDGTSSDSRRPDTISYVKTIEEDLARRDFTCNAIAMDITGKLIDPHDGKRDIQQRVIRFIGDPMQRILEDRLRILRAFSFASRLQFKIYDQTYKAICKAVGDPTLALRGVSQERITAELQKAITGKDAFTAIRQMAECGLLFLIIPELAEMQSAHSSPYHQETLEPWGNTIFAHTMLVLEHICHEESANTDTLLVLRLAALFHDIGKPECRKDKGDHDSFVGHDVVGAEMTKKIMTKMKFRHTIINRVINLVRYHMDMHDLIKTCKVTFIRKLLGRGDIEELLALALADEAATINNIREFKLIDMVNKYRQKYPVMLPPPLVTGKDLIKAGYQPGKAMGIMLAEAYNEQLRNEKITKQGLIQKFSYLAN